MVPIELILLVAEFGIKTAEDRMFYLTQLGREVHDAIIKWPIPFIVTLRGASPKVIKAKTVLDISNSTITKMSSDDAPLLGRITALVMRTSQWSNPRNVMPNLQVIYLIMDRQVGNISINTAYFSSLYLVRIVDRFGIHGFTSYDASPDVKMRYLVMEGATRHYYDVELDPAECEVRTISYSWSEMATLNNLKHLQCRIYDNGTLCVHRLAGEWAWNAPSNNKYDSYLSQRAISFWNPQIDFAKHLVRLVINVDAGGLNEIGPEFESLEELTIGIRDIKYIHHSVCARLIIYENMQGPEAAQGNKEGYYDINSGVMTSDIFQSLLVCNVGQLRKMPIIPGLIELRIRGSHDLTGEISDIYHDLIVFTICGCPNLVCPQLRGFHSLTNLYISECPQICGHIPNIDNIREVTLMGTNVRHKFGGETYNKLRYLYVTAPARVSGSLYVHPHLNMIRTDNEDLRVACDYGPLTHESSLGTYTKIRGMPPAAKIDLNNLEKLGLLELLL
jgi:hypothetical protein